MVDALPEPSIWGDTKAVASPFVQSMASNFEEALRLMEAVLTDCPDDGRRTCGRTRRPRPRHRTADCTEWRASRPKVTGRIDGWWGTWLLGPDRRLGG